MTRPDAAPLVPPEDSAVRLIDLPGEVNGLITESEDGFVNIYINARRSRAAQAAALQHELRHYYRGDLHSDRDIREVEADNDLEEIAAAVRDRLSEACQICDVARHSPRIPVDSLRRLVSGLTPAHFVPLDSALHVHHEDGGALDGTVFLDAHGQPDGATFLLHVVGDTVTVDLGHTLTIREIWHEPDGLLRERVY